MHFHPFNADARKGERDSKMKNDKADDVVDTREEIKKIKKLEKNIDLFKFLALLFGSFCLYFCLVWAIFSSIEKYTKEGIFFSALGLAAFIMVVISVVLTFLWSIKLATIYNDNARSIKNLEKNLSSIGHLNRDAYARNVVKEYLNVVQKKAQGKDRTGHAVNRTHPWIKDAVTTLHLSLSFNSPKDCTIGEDGCIFGVFNLGKIGESKDCVLEWKLGPNQFLLSVSHTPGGGVRFNNIPL